MSSIRVHLFVGLLTMAWIAAGPAASESGLKVSDRAPAFVLKSLDGENIWRSKKIFSGHPFTVLIFWDSYCLDCLKAVAACQKVYEQADSLGIELVSINFDDENLSDVRAFIKGEKIRFLVLSDRRKLVAKRYKAVEYDFSLFIVNCEGIIQHVCYDHPPEPVLHILKQLRILLKEKAKSPTKGKED